MIRLYHVWGKTYHSRKPENDQRQQRECQKNLEVNLEGFPTIPNARIRTIRELVRIGIAVNWNLYYMFQYLSS